MAKETVQKAFILGLAASALLAASCRTNSAIVKHSHKMEPAGHGESSKAVEAATQPAVAATLPTVAATQPSAPTPQAAPEAPAVPATPATKPAMPDVPPIPATPTTLPAAPATRQWPNLQTTPVTPAVPAPATQPASTVPATSPAATGEVANPLFTLPPSKGPAPYKFRQLTLYRSGPSGDLEMQLTGDGIYRIRDHANGRSYAGDGKLTDEQISQWAEGLKDWDSLKDSYLPEPAPKDKDIAEIVYGGKKVSAIIGNEQTPKAFADAFKRLTDLQEQSRKEAAEAAKAEPATKTLESPKAQ